MERQSTSKLYRALIAVVAFFVLCTSAILFASCGTNPLECEHTYGPGDVKEVRLATCGENGTVTYECSKCGALVTLTGTLATGDHKFVNGRCEKCGATSTEGELTLADLKADLTSILTALNTVAGKADVDKVASSVVAALKNPDTTIPNLWKLLTDIRDNISELDFDIDLVADGEPTTLKEVITSLYKQVNKLYLDLTDEGKNTDGLYDLLVGVGGTGTQEHVHNWVLELKPGTEYSCTTPNTYVWGCSFCDATKGDDVTVMATGHATEFKTGVNVEGHYYAATCISPARVEGYCANCEQYTGEWTTQGQPTYQHHYVLESGTDVDGNEGTAGSCTSVHQYVYHCETCGGAYVEEVKGNTQHNYYYSLNEDGTKRPMTDEEKIQVWNDAHPDDEIDSLDELTYAEEQELNELLKEDHLNIVYYSEPNCVDPALIVVECMECGVRYAYTFGQPDGHHFIRVHETVNATCTMDGVEQYFYCDHCGYFFFLDGITDDDLNDDDVVVTNIGSKAYTRNYMTDLDDNVINDKTDKALENQDAYDRASKEKDALGHDYVVVYTNTRKCVTAQDYILVCKRDGCLVEGKTFEELVQVEGEATVADALFYQATEDGPYFLNGLTGNNTTDAALLTALLAKKTADATTSDLTKEWNALVTADDAAIATWLEDHNYLVRDDDDDESVDTLKTLTGTELKALYHGENIISGFELPVKGHTFNDYFVTVVGGCILYERHVYFCAVCGQYTATPSSVTGTQPYTVSGDTDQFIAGIGAGEKTDLDLAWEAVCEAAAEDSENEQYILIKWLFDHGYLNDYRVRLTEDDVTDPDERLNAELNLVAERLQSLLGEELTPEWLEDQFTGKNVLEEYKVTKKFGQIDMMEDPDDPYFVLNDTDIELGHTFDAVTLLSEEVCDAPGRYVYVCSKCGDPLGVGEGTLEYMSGSATVDTGLDLIENPLFKSEDYILQASAQASRLALATDKLDKSDLYKIFDAITDPDDQFDWLLEHGYLNNVIDTYYTVGYTDEDDVLHGGWLALSIKGAESTEQLEGSIQEWYDTARGNFYENGALKADAVAEHKEYLKALALKLLDGEDPDITDYYEKSSNTFRTDPEDPETEVKDVPANKTIDNAATEVPMSGHLYAYEDGTRINLSENGDGICTDFRSKEVLEKYYNEHKLIYWDETLGTDGKANGWTVYGEFDPADLDPDFVAQVNKYGIVGACMRENCPYHTKYDIDEHTYDGEAASENGFTAGYLAATDHEMDYEKFEADDYGYPNESKVEKNQDGTKIRYNFDAIEEYMVADSAKYFAEGVGTGETNYDKWTSIATKAGLDKDAEDRTDDEAENYEILYNAATAARNNDLHNLYTLQWIWNTLFVPADWLNPEDKDLATTRQAMYPTIEIKDAEGNVLTDIGAQITRLTTLFQEANVSLLWTTNTKGEYISRWRPLTDNFEPSCWVSLRCKWYRTDGNKCSRIDPPTNHDFPAVGEFDYDTHVANCKHIDLCNCCGKPIGKPGKHKLIPVAPTEAEGNLLNSSSMKAAWIEVLKHYEDIDWLKDIIWVDEEANLTVDNWATCWRILEDTCYEGEGAEHIGKEDGHAIYVCSGELEVIYNEIVNAAESEAKTWEEVVGEGLEVEWKVASAADATNGNYFVETIDEEEHEFVTRYYSLNDFVLDGVKYEKNQLLAATEAEWNEKFAFSELVCNGGYYTLNVCSNIKRETDHVKEGEGACPAGCEHECGKVEEGSRRDYEPAGHTLAPVVNYWTFADRYTPPTDDHNAIMVQVCVICGEGFQSREYGVTDDGEGHEQYNVATQPMIDRWNDHVDAYNADVDVNLGEDEDPVYLQKAQLPRFEDITQGEAGGTHEAATYPDGNLAGQLVENVELFGSGVTTFKEDATLELPASSRVSSSTDATVLVGKGKTLSFKKSDKLTEGNSQIGVAGTLAFVGEDTTSTVDFSNIQELWLGYAGVGAGEDAPKPELLFENITVNLGDAYINAYGAYEKITFKNAIVKSNDAALRMNATSETLDGEIVIDHSTFISSNDVGLAIWNPALIVNANDSIFFGKNAGAFIRSGEAHFTNCEFYTVSGQKGTAWGEGTNTDVSAAIVIGNKEPADVAYGNAKVELANCDFGLCDAAYVETLGAGIMTAAEPTACDEENPAIAAFSSALNETEVKLDMTTVLNAGELSSNPGYKTENDKQVSTLKWDIPQPALADLGKTASEQAQNAAKLVESLAGLGGDINLPKIADETIAVNSVVAIPEGTTTTIALNGNTLDFAEDVYTNDVEGNLTISGGTVNLAAHANNAAALAVSGENAELTLDKVTVVAEAGILPNNGGKLVINDTVILSNHGYAISTNNTLIDPSITIEITNSTIASLDQTNGTGAGNTGNVGLMVNDTKVKLTATNSTFYGVRTGAWVRGGDATFTGCTFISGSAMIGGDWGDGNHYPDAAAAALLIGNGGSSTSYGNAKVTLTNCIGLVSKEVVKPGTDGKYVPDTGNKVTIDTTAGTGARIKADAATGEGLAKKIALTSYQDSTTTLTMDEASAKAFFGESISAVIGKEIVLGDSTPKANVTITYTTGTGDEKVEHEVLLTTVLTKDELTTKASGAITAAGTDGGKVVLPAPEAEAQPATVNVNEQLVVAAGKTTEIELNGNTLKLKETENVEGGYVSNGLAVVGELTLSNGTVEGGLGLGEDSNVTLNNVVVDHSSYDRDKTETYYGIMLSGESTDETSASLTLNNSSIKAVQPLYVNGNTDNATINLKNSDFLGLNGHGIWIAGNATIVAENCNFYGSVYAVEICSGNVTFKGCTFMNTNDTFSGVEEESEFFQYGGVAMPTSTYAPLIINAKGVNKGYDMAKVSVDAACLFYNIDAPGKWVPSEVFDADPEETEGLTEVKSKATGETLGWVKLKTTDLIGITLAYVKDQSPENAKLTFSIDETLGAKVVVKAFLFEFEGAASGSQQNVKKVAEWELADYFTVTGCTATKVTA